MIKEDFRFKKLNKVKVEPEDIEEGLEFTIPEETMEEGDFVNHKFEHFETIFSIKNKSKKPILFSVDKVYDYGKVLISSVSDVYKDGNLEKFSTLWTTRQLCNLIDKIVVNYRYKPSLPITEETANNINEAMEKTKDELSFGKIAGRMFETYIKKNHDYGNAFSEMYDELGINYGYGKIREKVNRIKTLKDDDAMVENEPLEDALLDCANYCILTLMEYQKHKENYKD